MQQETKEKAKKTILFGAHCHSITANCANLFAREKYCSRFGADLFASSGKIHYYFVVFPIAGVVSGKVR